VKVWFEKLERAKQLYNITSGKRILNIDESGARVGCPPGEHVIVPTEVKEMYTSSPTNRKSLTIIETIRGDGEKPLPPFIITPGEKIMQNWISEKLVGDETLDHSPTGYINNDLITKYADHLN
jgi:hypothetical protein